MGLGVARFYAARGARLVMGGRDEAKLARALDALPSGEAVAVAGNLAEPATARRLVDEACSRFGRIDLLVNNAGMFAAKPFVGYTLEEMNRLIEGNLRGTMLLSQAVVSQFRVQGSGGAIVSVTSAISLAPLAAIPAVVPNSTKGALNSFTRSLALELAAEGIRVNAVAPGLIKTPLLGPNGEDGTLAHLQPMGHLGEVSDVVEAIHYLASAPFVTGVVLPVDGGSSLGHW